MVYITRQLYDHSIRANGPVRRLVCQAARRAQLSKWISPLHLHQHWLEEEAPMSRARHGVQRLKSIAGYGRELSFDPAVDAGVKEIER